MSRDLAVVIPTYNRPVALQQALTSLACQELHRLGTIYVVNDGGHLIDGVEIPAVLRSRVAIIAVLHGGPAQARNAALRQVEEPLVSFLDDDAIAGEDWVTHCLETFDRFPAVTAQLGRIQWTWAQPEPDTGPRWRQLVARQRQMLYDHRHRLYSAPSFMDAMAKKLGLQLPPGLPGLAPHLSGGNGAVRRQFLLQHGFLNEKYHTFHDRELAWRVMTHAGIVAYNPLMCIRHDHDPSLWRSLKRCVRAIPYEEKLHRQYPRIARAMRELNSAQVSFSQPVAPRGSPESIYEMLLSVTHRAARALRAIRPTSTRTEVEP